MQLPQRFFDSRKIENMVENRTTYTVESAELNVYETHHFAEEVILQFHQPVLASMIEGKKIMHLRDQSPFDFLPGESIMMPSDEIMKIDFPEAAMNNPTRCLAMTIAPEKIEKIIDNMNYSLPRVNHREWELSDGNFTFTNDEAISQIIQRLIYLFAENHQSKDVFVDMMLRELIVRILQSENRKILSQKSDQLSNSHRLASTIEYIKDHLHMPISVAELSEHSCMSESNFHKVFKNELGVSPVQFINDERIKKAARLLQNPNIQIKEVYMCCGFSNVSYFIRTFKKILQATPREYQTDWAKSIS